MNSAITTTYVFYFFTRLVIEEIRRKVREESCVREYALKSYLLYHAYVRMYDEKDRLSIDLIGCCNIVVK